MKSRLRLFSLLLAVVFLSGCLNRDLTHTPPWALCTKQFVTIKREMALVVDDGSHNPYAQLELVEKGREECHRQRVRLLPKGSRLWIDRVFWVNALESAHVTAVGWTAAHEIFEFYLGSYQGQMKTPPWEEGKGEKAGLIGWEGKVTYERPYSWRVKR